MENVPLVTTEGGVGRGLEPISELKGIDSGNEFTSYASAATFITNKQRAFMCTNTHLGRANFTNDHIALMYWRTKEVNGYIISGDSFIDLSQKVSKTIGTMKPTPWWLS